MAEDDRDKPGKRRKTAATGSEARRPRSIRFADSEWDTVERAAARHGVPAGELVRSGALALAEDRLGAPPPATLSTGHAALIETIYRFVYVMATLRREELLDEDRDEELDGLVAEARRTMAETMEEGST